MKPFVSVIVPCRNEAPFLDPEVASFSRAVRKLPPRAVASPFWAMQVALRTS